MANNQTTDTKDFLDFGSNQVLSKDTSNAEETQAKPLVKRLSFQPSSSDDKQDAAFLSFAQGTEFEFNSCVDCTLDQMSP